MTGTPALAGAAGAPDSTGLPAFLEPLAQRLVGGSEVLAEPLRPVPPDADPRRSAVLLLISGTELEGASLLLEERAHSMRSQPAQFSLPGGGVEPEDADDVATALREAQEETGLDPRSVTVLGAFAPIAMPWRNYSVRPVVAHVPAAPSLTAHDPREVESVLWAPLVGAGSLTDPAVRRIGLLDGAPTGPAFDLPGEAFVWGFTALIVESLLASLGAPVPAGARPRVEVPELRRRGSGRRPR